MWIEEKSKNEAIEILYKYLENSKSTSSKSAEFNDWFIISKENLKLKYDSLYIFDKNFIETYDDCNTYLSGLPLFTIISYKDIDDSESEKIRLDIKIPMKLDILYNMALDEMGPYCVYYMPAGSNVFRSNVCEESVDVSYVTIKELFDSKFNIMRQLNYEDIPFTLSEILTKNAVGGFQMLIYELMTMTLSRQLDNASAEFRYTAKKKEPYDKFQMINIRDVSRNASAFSALSSENISKSVLTILGKSDRESGSEVLTPQEQISLSKF